jgi:hypothetical protein
MRPTPPVADRAPRLARLGRRGVLAVCAAVLAVVAIMSLPGIGLAQSVAPSPTVPVTLRLVDQTPWNGPKRPLVLTFSATNEGTSPLTSLLVALTIEAPARSRSVYDLSLTQDATASLLGAPFVERGALRPGVTRRFTVTERLDALAAFGQDAIYPLRVQLLSEDLLVGTLRTPMIFLTERPKVPLNLTWTWVLDEPIQYLPNGVFHPGPIEADIAPGGRMDTTVAALVSANVPADVAVTPTLLDQLRRMSAGYRIQEATGGTRVVAKGTGGAVDAARILSSLRSVASRPGNEVDAVPFGTARFPALLRSGLDTAPRTLLDRGRTLVQQALGAAPSADVLRPPGSELDRPTVTHLWGLGYRVALVDPGYVSIPRALGGFTPPPVVRLAEARSPLDLVVPDRTVATLAQSDPGDPVLAAHSALGELAAIWFEFPGTPGRGAAMLFGEAPAAAPGFLQAFAALVPRSPWLQPVSASTLIQQVASPARRALPARRTASFAPGYVPSLDAARGELGQFQQTAVAAASLVARLRDHLLLAEGSTFLSSPAAGEAFVRSVRHAITSTYREIRLDNPTAFTLTSRAGLLPITLRNHTGMAVRVQVRLVADRRLAFPSGNPRVVTLSSAAQSFTFPVRAETTGRIPIKIQVLTPNTRGVPDEITEVQTVVRSTAYNRVALFVTIGAALFLLAWWGRRFLPRRER